jgi:fumarylacetoacetate (FAA) hydrolase family protein
MTRPFDLPADGLFVSRAWDPGVDGPVVTRVDGDSVADITSAAIPTMQALLEHADPAQTARNAPGRPLCSLTALGPVDIQDSHRV